MSQSIIIWIYPVERCPGRYAARIEGDDRVLVKKSRQPFLDAARALLREGYDPHLAMVMRHLGSSIDALRGDIGVAAKLKIEELSDGSRRPRFVAALQVELGQPGTAIKELPATTLARKLKAAA